MDEKRLEEIIENYIKVDSLKELSLVEEFAFIFVNNRYNLNIDCYPFSDYIIKSDTLRFVHDFLYLVHPKYAEEFEEVLKNGKIIFLQTKKKKKEEKHNYEVIASYQLKDSFDLIHVFFEYWIHENAVLGKESDYFVDTFSVLGEFLFQDYLESLGYKNKEPYYQKMNRLIYTNIFTVHMIVELKLIELYRNHHSLKGNDPVSELQDHNISTRELLSKNCKIIIDDILSMNGFSFPYHKRYLYSIILASYIHQQILKKPKLLQNFCYLIDHPEDISVIEFMKAIGISMEVKDEKIVLSKTGYQELQQSFLAELEDCFIRANIDF